MEKPTVFFKNQIFVKTKMDKPFSETSEAYSNLNTLSAVVALEAKELRRKLQSREKITEDEINAYREDAALLKKYEDTITSSLEMNRFWILDFNPSMLLLKSVPFDKYDMRFMKGFKSPEELQKNYRSLSDIFENDQFIGRRVSSSAPMPAYILYDLGETTILAFLNETGEIDFVCPAPKNGPGSPYLTGAPNLDLKNKERIYRFIYKMNKKTDD